MAWTQIANIKGADGTDGTDGAPGTTTWAGITDKPAVIGAGATAGDARTAIGAGTSSLAIGTTTGTACAGNDTRLPAGADIVDSDISATAGIVGTKLAAAVQTSLGKADTALQSVTAHTQTLSTISDVTATAAEVNALHGIPAGLTATEIGYCDGVTSAIQTQLGTKAAATSATLTTPTITGYTETVQALGTKGTGTTVIPALSGGTIYTVTLTASQTTTFTMPSVAGGASFVVLVKQAASTGNGVATFTAVKWNASGTPVMTATAGRMDIFTFISDGTNWYGSVSQGYTY